ncbi:ChbG/HpnK family deacetylase [Pararhodospirillum oryzae]|uniref:ChbG/HpnK family deacetylase n=1 Tax=Pararhodospirillum oryzae TaxID=478448 RepID=A0A512H5T4_9PROT|nr:ChbG/HpnK family deacetylase [Pararhodospirillum oryzae]GEO80784.1 hypothetical protein ROR02_09150 [Pararhodospirillum oryzae]
MSTLDRIVFVYADDFGLADGVSRAIVALIEAGRLSGTGCMSVFPDWAPRARWLDGLEDRADIGLHLTLTDHPPLTGVSALAPRGCLPPLKRLLRLSLAGRLDQAALRAEIRAQVDAFVQARGQWPAFVDGHHHAHVLPGVREAVLAELAAPLAAGTLAVRDCWEPPARVVARGVAVPRALVLSALAWGMHRRLGALGVRRNEGFSGVHAFAPGAPYRPLFQRFLRVGGPRALIGCHPGWVDDTLSARDRVVDSRPGEYTYLASPAFLEDLADINARLGRLSRDPSFEAKRVDPPPPLWT